MPSVHVEEHLELCYFATSDHPSIIFLHGIMGSKKNLHGFVQKWCHEFPRASVIAFDLRNHGSSTKHCAPFTVEAAAHDIVRACDKLSLSPTAIVGHSFGGKVALCAALQLRHVQQLWLLDSSPSIVSRDESPGEARPLNTLDIIDILETIAWPLTSRRELVTLLLERRVDEAIALWMTTNLIAKSDGLHLIFTPSEMKAMLLDFVHLDGWPLITKLASNNVDVHLVRAERGDRVTDDDERLLQLHAKKRGYCHLLKNAGHFVHAENPAGLLSIMRPFVEKLVDPA